MNGGAVNDDKSPLNEAMDFKNEVHSAVSDIGVGVLGKGGVLVTKSTSPVR